VTFPRGNAEYRREIENRKKRAYGHFIIIIIIIIIIIYLDIFAVRAVSLDHILRACADPVSG
jgi:uncharacterized integral membrane protein